MDMSTIYWTVIYRLMAISAVLNNYLDIINALEHFTMASEGKIVINSYSLNSSE